MKQTLECEKCGKNWEREAKRGRKPNACPACTPSKVAKALVGDTVAAPETLICQHDGHAWVRPLTRGRKPPFCPEHRGSTPVAPVQAQPKRPRGVPNIDPRPPAVQAILNGPQSELRRKLEYIVNALENPSALRDKNDWDGIIETHKRYAREAERIALNKSTPVIVAEEGE